MQETSALAISDRSKVDINPVVSLVTLEAG